MSDADLALKSLTIHAVKRSSPSGDMPAYEVPQANLLFYAHPVGTYLGLSNRRDLLAGLESVPPSLEKGARDKLDVLFDIAFDKDLLEMKVIGTKSNNDYYGTRDKSGYPLLVFTPQDK